MDNSSNMAVNTTPTANQINPEHLYGLDKNKACLNNSCPSKTADIGYYIPAIDEIMRHNPCAPSVAHNDIAHNDMTEKVQKSNENPSLEQAEIAYEEGGSTSEEQPKNINKYSGSTSEEQPENINKYSGSLQNIPFIKGLKKIDTSVPVLPATPATTASSGATVAMPIRQNIGMSMSDYQYPFPVTAENLRYHNGFMRTQIGRRITVDFLVGANTIVQKTGYLLGVAQDYILINEIDTNDITTCDYYNIKFIKYYY